MHDEDNGGPKQLPAIMVGWNAESQTVHLAFDNQQFKTWDFVITLLEMAKLQAEDKKRMAVMANLQQQSQERAMAERVRQALNR